MAIVFQTRNHPVGRMAYKGKLKVLIPERGINLARLTGEQVLRFRLYIPPVVTNDPSFNTGASTPRYMHKDTSMFVRNHQHDPLRRCRAILQTNHTDVIPNSFSAFCKIDARYGRRSTLRATSTE